MIGVLIVTHGRLGEVLMETAAMLVGETESVRTVGFQPGEGVEDLETAVRGAMAELEPNDGILSLVDIPGGSPARVMGGLVLERPDLELVTGVNLSMVAEVLFARQSMTAADLARHALNCGTGGIVDLAAMLRAELMQGGETAGD